MGHILFFAVDLPIVIWVEVVEEVVVVLREVDIAEVDVEVRLGLTPLTLSALGPSSDDPP